MANAIASANWPIGFTYESVLSTNPASLLGIGTWTALGTGRVTVGIDAGQVEFDTVEETGGSSTHTLTTAELPVHTHTQNTHNHTQDPHDHTIANFGNVVNHESDEFGSSMVDNSGTKTTSSVTATNVAATATNQNAGGGEAHSNLMPYVVIYRWKRTA